MDLEMLEMRQGFDFTAKKVAGRKTMVRLAMTFIFFPSRSLASSKE
jgi:hypothetical protein